MMDIPYSLFSLSQLADLAFQIKALVEKKYSDEPMLVQFLQNTEAAYQKALKALGDDTHHEFAAKIREADQERDQAYKALRNFIKAGTERLDPVYNSTATSLYEVFQKNDLQLYRFSYSEQSDSLQQLFQDLEKKKEEVQLLQADDWVAELQDSQASFEKIYAESISAEVEKDVLSTMEAKKVLVPALDTLWSAVKILHEGKHPKEIDNTVSEIQEIIQKTVKTARG